uniref:Uncharacterized protein n=1 Tax=Chromera velia CCMP2878 TaxID=1169474 RepID=A0A0G4HBX8_9ALVE|eukprot:Cvel_920.t1-p1 / transcript=Cvel_920.t1 / gene=Cvel_920 / organism=Chromera_velia_CCMP2878 / gene_product=hypothetical protein / transcript_product=hypothetical protein / location=Cvel_scaffold29:71930-72403(+) / protein_length=158 / sequence_SO=supercontig / SO=protein_coding / is_pseudo=false
MDQETIMTKYLGSSHCLLLLDEINAILAYAKAEGQKKELYRFLKENFCIKKRRLYIFSSHRFFTVYEIPKLEKVLSGGDTERQVHVVHLPVLCNRWDDAKGLVQDAPSRAFASYFGRLLGLIVSERINRTSPQESVRGASALPPDKFDEWLFVLLNVA